MDVRHGRSGIVAENHWRRRAVGICSGCPFSWSQIVCSPITMVCGSRPALIALSNLLSAYHMFSAGGLDKSSPLDDPSVFQAPLCMSTCISGGQCWSS